MMLLLLTSWPLENGGQTSVLPERRGFLMVFKGGIEGEEQGQRVAIIGVRTAGAKSRLRAG